MRSINARRTSAAGKSRSTISTGWTLIRPILPSISRTPSWGTTALILMAVMVETVATTPRAMPVTRAAIPEVVVMAEGAVAVAEAAEGARVNQARRHIWLRAICALLAPSRTQ